MVRPFILLQLSDLHFGEHSRFHGQDMEELAGRCATAVAEARKDLGWQDPVGLVLATGDIAEAARPKEYRAALAFFSALAGHLNVERSRVVFVPGNHDVSWTKCQEVEGLIADGELDETAGRARLDAVKLARFDAMVRAFYDDEPYDESKGERGGQSGPARAGQVTAVAGGAYVHDFAELEVSVAALNSCERESHHETDHVGLVSEKQAQAVLDHWNKEAPGPRLRLLAVHHNPVASPPKQVKEWADWLRRKMKDGLLLRERFEPFAADVAGFEGREYLHRIAEQAQVSLLLHGHHHVSDSTHGWNWRGAASASGNTLVLSAGSWSLKAEKLPAEQPVVMQLVRIDPQKQQARAVLLRYDPGSSVAGKVAQGQFVTDGETRKQVPLSLSIPATLRGAKASRASRENGRASSKKSKSDSRAIEGTVEAYRARKRASFKEWEVRGVGAGQGGGNRQPAKANLDDMYVPLEVVLEASGGRATSRPKLRSSRGRAKVRSGGDAPMVLTPEAVFARETAMALVGPAGSGKTTWMKWMFRRLIELPNALPFFVELRALPADWRDRVAERRTIDAVLEDELATCRVDAPRETLRRLLARGAAVRPVLLVDGWDELGELGSDLRKRLDEFCSAHPHVLVVVSSRPHGDARPTEAAGFDTFEIQPLSDEAVRHLVHQFHHRVHGEAEPEAALATSELLVRLAAVPEAQALARTPLLLTMLLLLSREQPLPDKRHRLYEACLRNLLHAWPEQKKGALALHTEWRPDDSEQRLRVVSSVAYQLQAVAKPLGASTAILAPRSDLVSMLPAEWSAKQREGFVEWLINKAGVLVDRNDAMITFAHLSFQEFLAAYYLFRTTEGDARCSAMVEHAVQPRWQESLRQWAGLLHDQDPAKLEPVLAELRTHAETTWLAGAILADGAGQESEVETWACGLNANQVRLARNNFYVCGRAWAVSRQEKRRQRVSSALKAAAARSTWLDALQLELWGMSAGLQWKAPKALQELAKPWATEGALARSRATLGASWLMPGHGAGVLLRLWPSRRSRVAISLQTLVSVGGGARALQQVARAQLRCEEASQDKLARGFVRDFVGEFGLHLGKESVREFVRDFGKAFVVHLGGDFGWEARDLFRDFSREVRDVGRDFVREFVREFGVDVSKTVDQNLMLAFGWTLGREFSRRSIRNVVRDVGRDFVQDFGGDFVQNLIRDFAWDFAWDFIWKSGRGTISDVLRAAWKLDEASVAGPWWPAFVQLELASVVGRTSARSVLASDLLGPIDAPSSELCLFRLACRASLHPKKDASQLEEALAGYRGDPLWPALARHLARRSTPEDRALLENLARHPEKRKGVLSWCLRYYVRGDLLLQDGSVLTIDQLCRQLGLEPLPLLEDLPKELPFPRLPV